MINKENKFQASLNVGASISQIGMLGLVAFGYFYTVIPVYQKEKLAEEVALLQGKINIQNEQLLTATKELAPLKSKKLELSRSLDELKGEFKRISSLKNEMEKQMAFMEYKFHLPDGTPATSEKQVKEVAKIRKKQSIENAKKQYFLMLHFTNISLGRRKGMENLFSNRYLDRDDSLNVYPFTKEEYEVIKKENGLQIFIRSQSLALLEKYHKKIRTDSPKNNISFLEKWREAAEDIISSKKVSLSFEKKLDQLPVAYRKEKNDLEQKMKKKLKEVEKEYEGWESTWDSNKKEILKHNYETSKINVKNDYKYRLTSL